MTNCFHLAIPAGNIKTALKFYCDILGCKTGNQEEGLGSILIFGKWTHVAWNEI